MEKKPKVIVRLNIIDFDKKIQKNLVEKLKDLIKINCGDEINICFLNAEEYEKIPGRTDCFFGAYANFAISIKKLMMIFGVEWSYSVCPTYNVDDPEDRIEENESAVWDQASHGGVLLHPNVKWADIYTWSE